MEKESRVDIEEENAYAGRIKPGFNILFMDFIFILSSIIKNDQEIKQFD